MDVASIMSSPVVVVEMDDTLAIVREIFTKTRFHHLLVVGNGKLVGVISDRDLLKTISPNIGTVAEKASDLATLNKKVHQVMSRNPVCVAPGDSINRAIELFQQHSFSCLPVIDEHSKPVGIVSWRDIFKALKPIG